MTGVAPTPEDPFQQREEFSGAGRVERLEREVKLAIWPGFILPVAGALVEGATLVPEPERVLDAIYYDTAELALARRGITLRGRSEQPGTTTTWTLKLPSEADLLPGMLARTEIEVVTGEAGDGGVAPGGVAPGGVAPGGTGSGTGEPAPDDGDQSPRAGGPVAPAGGAMVGSAGLPAELTDAVTAYVRTSPLGPVAHLRTARRTHRLIGSDGGKVADLDDDEVSVFDGQHVAARFRELEIELDPAAPSELLAAMVAVLHASGAEAAEQAPKLMRALGPRALDPPTPVAPTLHPKGGFPTMADVVRAGFARSANAVLDHDHVIRFDADIEGVHQARVGTRRMRSDLRTFGPVLNQRWAEALRTQLRWLAGELGTVRDADVLLARLHRDLDLLPDKRDQESGERLLATLKRQRERAQAHLLARMRTQRYVRLLERIVAAAETPRLTIEASLPAPLVLPQLVRDPWRKLRRDVRRLGRDPSHEQLHALRIRVKRARYAADVAVPVIGAPAKSFTKALGGLQDVLGELHDTSVAEAWLRRAAERAPREQALAAGQLIALQRAEADEHAAQWLAAWRRVDRARNTRWIR